MPKEIVSTDDAPKGLAGYSQAVKANGLVFVSGDGRKDTYRTKSSKSQSDRVTHA